MIHAMIDLETLGTGVDCAVLSCGLVCFDENGLRGHGYYTLLDLDEQIRLRKVDASTIKWWSKQSDAARGAAFGDGDTANIERLHKELTYNLNGAERVWSQGANFDIAILDHMFRAAGLKTPWKYNAARDTRTIYDYIPKDAWPVRTGTHHNALDDAKYQAECVIVAMKLLAGNHQQSAG